MVYYIILGYFLVGLISFLITIRIDNVEIDEQTLIGGLLCCIFGYFSIVILIILLMDQFQVNLFKILNYRIGKKEEINKL